MGNLPTNTRDQLARLDKPARDAVVEELRVGKLTRQQAPARIQEERVRQEPKTGRGHSRPKAAAGVREDAARDHKKFADQAEELVAILRDLTPERFDEFRKLYLRTPTAKFATALMKAEPTMPTH